MHFCKIENFTYGEINERSFSNPHPRSDSGVVVILGVSEGPGWELVSFSTITTTPERRVDGLHGRGHGDRYLGIVGVLLKRSNKT